MVFIAPPPQILLELRRHQERLPDSFQGGLGFSKHGHTFLLVIFRYPFYKPQGGGGPYTKHRYLANLPYRILSSVVSTTYLKSLLSPLLIRGRSYRTPRIVTRRSQRDRKHPWQHYALFICMICIHLTILVSIPSRTGTIMKIIENS